MRVFLSFILVVLYATVALAESVQPVSIVAVVDDQVISSVDLDDRVMLMMALSGIPDTPENRAKLTPQILRQLVEEKLQTQEAGRLGITISDARLKEGIAKLEQLNNKPPGSIEQFLDSKGVNKLTFYAQVRAQLMWSDIVLKKIRPKIRISDQEVAHYVKRQAESSNQSQEVQITIIQLPVDSPENEANVRKTAEKLADEIHSGASFEAIAGQFSSGTGGTKASEPIWVDLNQLDPPVAAALNKAGKGGITDPVRTATGYQIIKFNDTRQGHAVQPANVAEPQPRAELAYKQILMKLKPTDQSKDAQVLLELAKQVQKAPGKCEDKSMSGVGDLAAFDFDVTFARAISSDLSDKLRTLLMGIKVGGVSEPVITPEGIRLFMLCERMEMPPAKPEAVAGAGPRPSDDAIRQAIYEEKLELEAQKYLRNLRREAFIEIRLHSPQ